MLEQILETYPQTTYNPQELNTLLTLLFKHNKKHLDNFLKEYGIPYSYDKPKLRELVKDHVVANKLTFDELVGLLNKIEGWGKQQIYLYKAPDHISRLWQDESRVRNLLEQADVGDLFNQSRSLILPDHPTLTSIDWTAQNVRFVWIEKRPWRERVPGEDKNENQSRENPELKGDPILVWDAYRVNYSRSLIVFDWNFITNDAMLLIQRVHNGRENYVSIRDRFEAELSNIIDMNSFEKVRLSYGLRLIEKSDETRRHKMTFQSIANRGKIAVASPNRHDDVFEDEVIEGIQVVLGDRVAGLLGNFYWFPVDGQLSCEVYTLIYGSKAEDQRIGILAAHKEQDIRYVLSRIRHYCR